MKARLSLRIDVTKIDKSRLFVGAKGTYLNVTTLVDFDEKDQYDNNGFISEDTSKEEREQGVQGNILGNTKVTWSDGEPVATQNAPQSSGQAPQPIKQAEFDEEIPF